MHSDWSLWHIGYKSMVMAWMKNTLIHTHLEVVQGKIVIEN